MRIFYGICLAVFLLIVALSSNRLLAEWKANGTPVCAHSYHQYLSNIGDAIAADGKEGAIVTWMDERIPGTGIYAQRIDTYGDVAWAGDGVAVSLLPSSLYPAIISDGSGGAIITWVDQRVGVPNYQYDISAQRVDSVGNVQWIANGVVVCSDPYEQSSPQLVTDGAGGAIVTWQDARDASEVFVDDIYAQRIDANGNVLWAADGVPICILSTRQQMPRIATDGAGGAIIIWNDYRNGNLDIYAQRIDSGGNVRWTSNGIPLSTLTSNQQDPEMISDGAGGAIVAWYDSRSGTSEIYAQRFDANGSMLWTADGVKISTALVGSKVLPQLAPDGLGGAIITWRDMNLPTGGSNIWARRINAAGVILWPPDGVVICTPEKRPGNPEIGSDGAGGAFITWVSWRTYQGSYDVSDIRCQRINADGAVQWNVNGVTVRDLGVYDHPFPYPKVTAASPGAAIIAWTDRRSGQGDIYAQKVDADGSVVTAAETNPGLTVLYQNHPNPFNPSTTIRYHLPDVCRVRLEVFDISGRRIASLVDMQQEEGSYAVGWSGKDERGISVASGIYFYQLTAGRESISKKMVLLR